MKALPKELRKDTPHKRNPSHSENPIYPSAAKLPAVYQVSDDVLKIMDQYDLKVLGNLRAHAIGFLSAWLEHLTFAEALEASGLKWGNVSHWQQLSQGFDDLYHEVKRLVDLKKAQVLEDKAFQRGNKGSKVIDGHYAPSDVMTKMVLGAILPGKYGRDLEGQAQAVQVNINI